MPSFSESIADDSASLSDWDDIALIAFVYACMKAGYIDAEAFDMIGREVTSRDKFDADWHGLGNLAAAFSQCREASVTPRVMEMCFQKFQNGMTRGDRLDADLEAVADIFSSIPVAQSLSASIPSNFLDDMAKLAIVKSDESRMEDVRDILMAVSRMEGLDTNIRRDLLDTFKHIYDRFREDMHPGRQKEIDKLYQGSSAHY